MKTVRVVVIEDHEYDAVKRKVGDTYDADPRFLPILTRLKRVKVADTVVATKEPAKNEYKRRDMKAEK